MFEVATRNARNPSNGVVLVMDVSKISLVNMNTEFERETCMMSDVFPWIIRYVFLLLMLVLCLPSQ